ncbi:hypothetical protein ACMGE9_11885 [Macrococcus sp. EM39E]|uniref:hypothetical protein n=1 Tax=Macrococcus animalis TaxID=3395467 RepID=UPI0039BF8D30
MNIKNVIATCLLLIGLCIIALGIKESGFDLSNIDFMSMWISGIFTCCLGICISTIDNLLKVICLIIALIASIHYLLILQMEQIVTLISVIFTAGFFVILIIYIWKKGEKVWKS